MVVSLPEIAIYIPMIPSYIGIDRVSAVSGFDWLTDILKPLLCTRNIT